MFCKEFEVTQMALDIEDMGRLFKKYNPIIAKAFNEHCFKQNQICARIESIQQEIEDPTQWESKVFLANTSAINSMKIEELIKK